MIQHPIEPIYNENSRILILGSFPSVKSREAGFFYGHPQNRFWRVLAAIFESDLPVTIEEKKNFLYNNRVAAWNLERLIEEWGKFVKHTKEQNKS